MPFVPIAFIFSALLCLAICQFILDGKMRSHYVFFVLFVVEMLQSVLIGLNWGYGIREVLVLQSLIATTIPPLIWLSYQSLIRPIGKRDFLRHSFACIIMIIVYLLGWLMLVDVVIITTFLCYGLAILRIASKGEDILSLVRHDSVERCFYLFRLTGWMLLASAGLEILIVFDMMHTGGKTAGLIVSIGNLLFLLVLWLIAFLMHSGKTMDEALPPETNDDNQELPLIAEKIDALMQDGLYKDLELNTAKIARKVGVPVRKISQAINRTHGKSVSQYVNQFRIREACRLLTNTQDNITNIALNAGFMTKSNFHREFLRITHTTPTQWRKNGASAASTKTPALPDEFIALKKPK